MLKPEDYRPQPAQPGTPPRSETDRVVSILDQRAQDAHPLSDANFPFSMRIMVNREERKGTFRGNDLLVPLSKGEVYEIWVSNRSGKLVLMRLLVDGLNTLPEPVRAKAMVVEGKVDKAGKTEYRQAMRVGLNEARAWILDPSDPHVAKVGGAATWAVRGFVNSHRCPGQPASSWWSMTRQSLAARQQFTDQIGLITAAFYEAGSSPPAASGMGEGDEREEDLTERDGPPVGRLLAVVNIRYVDAAALAGNEK